MAHSIQVVYNTNYIFSDSDLVALVALARLELDSPIDFRIAREIVENWERHLEWYGPGVIHLELEQLLSDPDKKLALAQLLKQVRSRLERFGSFIPANILNSHSVVHDIVFQDLSTAFVIATIDTIEGILRLK